MPFDIFMIWYLTCYFCQVKFIHAQTVKNKKWFFLNLIIMTNISTYMYYLKGTIYVNRYKIIIKNFINYLFGLERKF